MAGGELANFFIRLSTIFDDSGFKKAQAGIKETESATAKLTGVLGELGLAVSAGAAIWGLIDFSKQSVEAFAEQERANMRLQNAMQNLGVFTKKAYEANLEFASSLQRTTTFSDDAIIEAEALLTTYGLYGDKLRNTVIAATDLATARHLDMNTAVLLLGKAFNGQTETLARYGLAINKTGDNARDFQQVLDSISTRMGGSAVRATDDLIGKAAQLKNAFGELKEAIGRELAPATESYISDLRTIADGITEYINRRHEANRADKTEIERLSEKRFNLLQTKQITDDQMKQLISSGHATEAAAMKESKAYRLVVGELRELNDQISRKMSLQKQEPEKPVKPAVEPPKWSDDALNASMKAAQDELQLQQEADRRINSAKMTSEQIQLIEAQAFADKVMLAGQYDKADELRSVAKEKYEKDVNARRIAGQASTFGYIAGLANSHNKVLAGIGKAAAIAEATINGSVAFTRTMAFFPAPINYILAGAVLAACMAQVATIAGVQLAEGGMLKAKNGGTPAILAEAGHDEVAIPLDDARTKARLADTLLPKGFTPADLVRASERGGGASVGRGSSSVNVQQVVNISGNIGGEKGGDERSNLLNIMDGIRKAARDGVSEALDMSKQVYNTGAARSGEA